MRGIRHHIKRSLVESLSFREHRALSAQRTIQVSRRTQEAHTSTSALPTPAEPDDEMEPMALSETAKKWFNQHGLGGFLRIAEAPPHDEAEEVVQKIDTEVITEEAIRALIGLPEGGIYSIENPSPETLTKFFGEYSLASKAHRTQGGEDPLFREVARVLHEYGFVYPRPLAMPKNKAGFIIATYTGVQVDWSVIIADCLRTAIESVQNSKKLWTVVAQWLTLLAPPVEPVRTKKRVRVTETTPNKPSKRQQLLAKHTPRWKEGSTSQQGKEPPSRKRQAETETPVEPPVRPLKIKLRRQEQEPDPLATKINIRTQEEEAEEDPADNLLGR